MKFITIAIAIILSSFTYADMIRVPDEALPAVLLTGGILIIKNSHSSIEGEYSDISVITIGSFSPKITFNGTKGKKVTIPENF
jgi:hypothetical protein